MNTAINALLLAAGVFSAASILATAFNSNELPDKRPVLGAEVLAVALRSISTYKLSRKLR